MTRLRSGRGSGRWKLSLGRRPHRRAGDKVGWAGHSRVPFGYGYGFCLALLGGSEMAFPHMCACFNVPGVSLCTVVPRDVHFKKINKKSLKLSTSSMPFYFSIMMRVDRVGWVGEREQGQIFRFEIPEVLLQDSATLLSDSPHSTSVWLWGPGLKLPSDVLCYLIL